MAHVLMTAAMLPYAVSESLLPIFFMHGVNDDHGEFAGMQDWVREMDPDVFTYSLPICDGSASYANLWDQGQQIMDRIREQIEASPDTFKDGYALVAHSQGALTARTAIERMDDHNVHTFISLAGPQMGQYGIPEVPADQPLLQELAKVGNDLVYTIAFQGLKAKAFQEWLSFANFWNDPRTKAGLLAHPHAAYLNGNTFLPVLNNDPGRGSQGPQKSKDDAEAARYKANFLRLQHAVFTAGTEDEMIMPYHSSVFDFWDETLQNIVPLNTTAMWNEDWLGLRQLDEAGKLTFTTVEGLNHGAWSRNKDVFLAHIAQHLPMRPSLRGEVVV